MKEREEIDALLDTWAIGFQAFEKRKTIQKYSHCVIREKTIGYLLQSKWLIGKIWIDTCFSREEAVYDLHLAKFYKIIELAKQAEAIQIFNTHPRAKFTFEMGFIPLLAFVLIKCRLLSLRIAAMKLIKALAHEKESLWNLNTFTAFATHIIQFEHGLQLELEEDIADVADDGVMVWLHCGRK
ncbi:hypothetical protein EsH8_II_001580 [Colletotrichum jinshuiense]